MWLFSEISLKDRKEHSLNIRVIIYRWCWLWYVFVGTSVSSVVKETRCVFGAVFLSVRLEITNEAHNSPECRVRTSSLWLCPNIHIYTTRFSLLFVKKDIYYIFFSLILKLKLLSEILLIVLFVLFFVCYLLIYCMFSSC